METSNQHRIPLDCTPESIEQLYQQRMALNQQWHDIALVKIATKVMQIITEEKEFMETESMLKYPFPEHVTLRGFEEDDTIRVVIRFHTKTSTQEHNADSPILNEIAERIVQEVSTMANFDWYCLDINDKRYTINTNGSVADFIRAFDAEVAARYEKEQLMQSVEHQVTHIQKHTRL